MRGLWRLKNLSRKLKREYYILAYRFPEHVECNICGWKGRRFLSNSWHPYTICPRCRSEVRHRLLFEALTTIPTVSCDALLAGKRILHFAPEPVLANLLSRRSARCVTADRYANGVDIQLDICDMKAFADGSFDVIIACDVLEHVPDDSSALREIHRVLTQNGWAILTVPQKDNLEKTYENPSITTPEGRKEAFGQEDHLRIYGEDFALRVSAHGFSITSIDERDFDAELMRKHVLFPPVLSDHPLATNHRKVFFAQKHPA
jgi:SAM-dependent methyltransferase